MRPDNIYIACDGLQVHGPTNNAVTPSASGDVQQIVDATASKKWAHLTICDSPPQCIQDIENCPLRYSSIQAHIFPCNSLTTRRDTSLVIRGSWTTRSATLHYEHDFLMTLDIPSTSGTDCSISGADLSTAWCHCHLSQNGSVETCVSKFTVLSSDGAAPPLPNVLIIQWSALPASSGPIYGACAISTGGPPETIAQTRIGCGGFQLHGPSGDARSLIPRMDKS